MFVKISLRLETGGKVVFYDTQYFDNEETRDKFLYKLSDAHPTIDFIYETVKT